MDPSGFTAAQQMELNRVRAEGEQAGRNLERARVVALADALEPLGAFELLSAAIRDASITVNHPVVVVVIDRLKAAQAD